VPRQLVHRGELDGSVLRKAFRMYRLDDWEWSE
jgi:hypothetical protein